MSKIEYILRLRFIGDGDAALRLRAALKQLLRVFRLRCVSVREVRPDALICTGRSNPRTVVSETGRDVALGHIERLRDVILAVVAVYEIDHLADFTDPVVKQTKTAALDLLGGGG